jgi:hypothetical protein
VKIILKNSKKVKKNCRLGFSEDLCVTIQVGGFFEDTFFSKEQGKMDFWRTIEFL